MYTVYVPHLYVYIHHVVDYGHKFVGFISES